mmetsp:Transcript_29721/g.74862  ORF Transcript_29721/g.74862 Transcript_29721/m.74862 type:complete len:129 (-) Transcript_29721:272-658(-)
MVIVRKMAFTLSSSLACVYASCSMRNEPWMHVQSTSQLLHQWAAMRYSRGLAYGVATACCAKSRVGRLPENMYRAGVTAESEALSTAASEGRASRRGLRLLAWQQFPCCILVIVMGTCSRLRKVGESA